MYGLLIILGVLVAAFIAEYLAKKQGLNIDILWDGLLVILVFGLVGARTFHVLEFWDYYSMEPGSIPLLWKGGLNIIGGLMLALPSIILFLKIKNAPKNKPKMPKKYLSTLTASNTTNNTNEISIGIKYAWSSLLFITKLILE